jgi:hypothetical protein
MLTYIKWTDISLGITVFLTGLYGGVGFFTAMGGNPSLAQLSDRTFAEYWQRIDSFMGARMPIAGPVIILSILVSTVLLAKQRPSISFILMLLSLLVMIADVVFTLKVNHPYNRLIQSWDLDNLPSNVSEIKMRVYSAFNVRMVFMISSFALAVLSAWQRFLDQR